MTLKNLRDQMCRDVARLDIYAKSNGYKKKDWEKVRTFFIIHIAEYKFQFRLLWLNEIKNKIYV